VPFVSEYKRDLHHFVRLHPNKQFEQNSATVITTTLTDNEMDLKMRLFNPTCAIKSIQSNQTRNFDRRNSHCGNHRCFSESIVAGVEDVIVYNSVEEEQQDIDYKLAE